VSSILILPFCGSTLNFESSSFFNGGSFFILSMSIPVKIKGHNCIRRTLCSIGYFYFYCCSLMSVIRCRDVNLLIVSLLDYLASKLSAEASGIVPFLSAIYLNKCRTFGIINHIFLSMLENISNLRQFLNILLSSLFFTK
jgi:hypothetical protein